MESLKSKNHQSSSFEQAANQWVIYKRYSNFVDLHDVLLPYFKAEGLQIPPLPPKIANEANSQRNLALT